MSSLANHGRQAILLPHTFVSTVLAVTFLTMASSVPGYDFANVVIPQSTFLYSISITGWKYEGGGLLLVSTNLALHYICLPNGSSALHHFACHKHCVDS